MIAQKKNKPTYKTVSDTFLKTSLRIKSEAPKGYAESEKPLSLTVRGKPFEATQFAITKANPETGLAVIFAAGTHFGDRAQLIGTLNDDNVVEKAHLVVRPSGRNDAIEYSGSGKFDSVQSEIIPRYNRHR